MWSGKGSIDVIDLGHEFYLVKFYSQEDLDYALLEGPWKIYDHYLAVRCWEPNFNPLLVTIDKITAWVRLPGLPIELYDRSILRKIGELIGRVVKVDTNTEKMYRGKFARLCVEVDLTKPLIGKYMINGVCFKVEYEGLHQICFTCGRADHDQKNCILERKQAGGELGENSRKECEKKIDQDLPHEENKEEDINRAKEKGKQVFQQSSDNFGPWMIVQRPKRGRKSEGDPKNEARTSKMEGENTSNSRFQVLEIEEAENRNEGDANMEPNENTIADAQRNSADQSVKTKARNNRNNQQKQQMKNNRNTSDMHTQDQEIDNAEKKQREPKESKEKEANQKITIQENFIIHHQDNWQENNYESPNTDHMEEEVDISQQANPPNGKPPDPTIEGGKRDAKRDKEMGKALVNDIDFTTPIIKG
nr:uncharacterized protein LOC112708979 [Arachis hypogaea]